MPPLFLFSLPSASTLLFPRIPHYPLRQLLNHPGNLNTQPDLLSVSDERPRKDLFHLRVWKKRKEKKAKTKHEGREFIQSESTCSLIISHPSSVTRGTSRERMNVADQKGRHGARRACHKVGKAQHPRLAGRSAWDTRDFRTVSVISAMDNRAARKVNVSRAR